MAHPAMDFLRLLDPSLEARFNIETYTDAKEKPKVNPLSKRFPKQTLKQVELLLPTLETLNQQGAAIYVAVNEFAGQRDLNNLARVRGVHADLDDASQTQLLTLKSMLEPSIVVQSSSPQKQHWYWLLSEGERLETDITKAINQGLVPLGADKAAVDVSRLLRLPGFRHMKAYDPEQRVLNDTNGHCTAPIVTVLSTGPRYDAETLLSSLPQKQQDNAASAHGISKDEPSSSVDLQPLIDEAIQQFRHNESTLWNGDWAKCFEPFTGELTFPSQSEADYYLARRIAHWGARKNLSKSDLQDLVEEVFEKSGLAQRNKWIQRSDYRARTITAACVGLNVISAFPTVTLLNSAAAVEPDWTLKGDLITARFFRDRYVDRFVFIRGRDKWLHWDDRKEQWRWCDLGEHIQAAKHVAFDLYQKSCFRAAQNPDKGTKLISEIASLQRKPRIDAMLELAKSEDGMSKTYETLDAHSELLGVKNGIVNLRSGSLQPNKPTWYITKYTNIDYSEDVTCPMFQSFLLDVFEGDTATIDAVHSLSGLTLTGRTDEELIVFCVGTGANGKSIFGNIMSSVFGSYAVTAPSSLLAARRSDDHGARSDLAMLNGARLVSINELPGGMMLDETVTKQLAGREPISARFLHKEFFTFLPSFTPWVRTNHRPIVKGTDNGIWRRLVIVPFRRTFTPEEQDNDLPDKLHDELEGILAWLVKGAGIYLKTGLRNSPAMSRELAQYRSDSDLLGEFLTERTLSGPTAEVKRSELYDKYKFWCERSGLKPVSKRALSEQLSERGFGQRKSGSDRFFTGLDIAPPTFTGG
jgi:putative DNA primase/helicase